MRLGERFAGKKFRDRAFGNRGIVVRIVRVSAALTDELGLTKPVVPKLSGMRGDSEITRRSAYPAAENGQSLVAGRS